MKAILFGGTGLVGARVLDLLLQESSYKEVHSFSRKKIDKTHSKLVQHNFDFENILEHANEIDGDHLFCCFGTTLKSAGSREHFLKWDKDFVLRIARMAAMKGVAGFSYISAKGANPNSSFLYLRSKGETESELQRMPFKQMIIHRPGLLMGDRKEFRLGEKLAICLVRLTAKIGIRFGATDVNELSKIVVHESLKSEEFGTRFIESYESN